jgi:hypothetical protein
MTSSGEKGSVAETELRLLVFSVGGIRFAADADQVVSLQQCDLASLPEHARFFHEVVGFADRAVEYLCPEICTVTSGDGICRLVIESPEDIISVPLEVLRPLPSLIEPFAVQRGIWAGIPETNRVLLAIDLCRLASTGNLWKKQGDIS